MAEKIQKTKKSPLHVCFVANVTECDVSFPQLSAALVLSAILQTQKHKQTLSKLSITHVAFKQDNTSVISPSAVRSLCVWGLQGGLSITHCLIESVKWEMCILMVTQGTLNISLVSLSQWPSLCLIMFVHIYNRNVTVFFFFFLFLTAAHLIKSYSILLLCHSFFLIWMLSSSHSLSFVWYVLILLFTPSSVSIFILFIFSPVFLVYVWCFTLYHPVFYLLIFYSFFSHFHAEMHHLPFAAFISLTIKCKELSSCYLIDFFPLMLSLSTYWFTHYQLVA